MQFDRLTQLQQHVKNGFDLIRENEELLQTETQPEGRLGAERWIEKHWRMIVGFIAQAKHICKQQSNQTPEWLLEAEASVPPLVWEKMKDALTQSDESLATMSDTSISSWEDHTTMAKIIPFPTIRFEYPSDWNQSRVQYAQTSVVLQRTRRILNERTAFRMGELADLGDRIGQVRGWASGLESIIRKSPELLLNQAIQIRAFDDLQYMRNLAERIEISLDDLDMTVALGKELPPQSLDRLQRHIRAMEHYVASTCDWMALGGTEATSNEKYRFHIGNRVASMNDPGQQRSDQVEASPTPETYKEQIAGQVYKLSVRCKTHAHLLEVQDIQSVINILAPLIDDIDDGVKQLNPEQGSEIAQWQMIRKLADGIRNRCFSLAGGLETYGAGMKPPDFFDVLSPLPMQLSQLAEKLPSDFSRRESEGEIARVA